MKKFNKNRSLTVLIRFCISLPVLFFIFCCVNGSVGGAILMVILGFPATVILASLSLIPAMFLFGFLHWLTPRDKDISLKATLWSYATASTICLLPLWFGGPTFSEDSPLLFKALLIIPLLVGIAGYYFVLPEEKRISEDEVLNEMD